MPLETRDHDPYWAARFRMTPQQLADARERARQGVNNAITAATRVMTPATEAAHIAAQESGEAVRQAAAKPRPIG